MRDTLSLLFICAATVLTAPLASADYSNNRDVTTAALSTLTRSVLETLYPVSNSSAPFPANLQPLDRRYIDTLFRRHLGYGVTPTYLRVVETIGDANEFIMTRASGRNANQFWHRYSEYYDGNLSMNISDRYIREWKTAAVRAINMSQHYEARLLVGQALHIVMDGHRVPGGNGSLNQTAVEAAEALLGEIRGLVSASLMRDFLGITGRKRGRELTVVVDVTFRDRGGVDRLRAIARWAADFAAASPTVDVPSKFTVCMSRSDYSVDLRSAENGSQSIVELMNMIIDICSANTTTNLLCPETSAGQNINAPRDILTILDKAARRAEIGSTIALFTDARFSTNPRMHVPLLQTKNQQLIIVGDPPYAHDRPIYRNLAEKTGGCVIYSGRFVDEIYPYTGFLNHAAKENVVLVAAIDLSLQNEIETEVALLPGDTPLGIFVHSDLHVLVDITANGSYSSHLRGSWVSAPPHITGTWKFKVKGGVEGLLGWSFKAYIQSDIFHNMGLYQYANVTEYNPLTLLQADRGRMWQHSAYVPLMGNPLPARPYTILLTTPQCENCESQPLNVELVGEAGNLIGTVTAIENSNQYLAAEISTPLRPFRIAVSGMHQGKRYKRYSPRLITPTNHLLEINWSRPIDVMTPDARTFASVLYSAPVNSTARLDTKEILNFLSNMTKVVYPEETSIKQYKFNVTIPNNYFIYDQPIDEMVFAVLTEDDQMSADNFIVQHVSMIGSVFPFPPKCTIVESTHDTCATNPGCDNTYHAKVQVVDDYDGFQYHRQSVAFFDTWDEPTTITRFVDNDGRFVLVKEVWNEKCCKPARVYATDANGEEGDACFFAPPPPTAGAGGMAGITLMLTMAALATVFMF